MRRGRWKVVFLFCELLAPQKQFGVRCAGRTPLKNRFITAKVRVRASEQDWLARTRPVLHIFVRVCASIEAQLRTFDHYISLTNC